MKQLSSGGRLKMLSALTLTIVAIGVATAVHTPGGPRTLTRFEPDRLAQLETDMWRVYYAKARLRLFALLVTTLREQYGYSWARAVQAGRSRLGRSGRHAGKTAAGRRADSFR